MGMLIFILFIIQFILIFAVIILFTRQNRLVEMEKKQQQIQAESEEMLAVFLMELKEENEQFISKVSNFHKEKQFLTNEEAAQTADHESSLEEEQLVGSGGPKIDSEAYSRLLTEQRYRKPLNHTTGQTEDFLENKSLVEKVEYFHKKGLSVEEIAKKLGKGKTEIQLMLKFNVE